MKSAQSARALAVLCVARVLRERITLERALAAGLEGADAARRSAARSLSYGAVRGYFRHEALLARLLRGASRSPDPTVRALLSVALFEIEDAKTPQYAVVDAAVETARAVGAGRAAGLINAVLRRYLRERAALDARIAADPAALHGTPAWLLERLRRDWPSQCTDVLAAIGTQAPMWLRVDARRTDAAAYVETLRGAGIAARAFAPLPLAVALESPREVSELPGFEDGLVSVQDLGAQCVASPLGLAAGQRVLDACAAPGGKTALMAERQPCLAALIAVDVDAQRLARVGENLARGSLEAQLVQGDAARPQSWWDGRPFDRILLDAPCSALGVIRRHPDIRLRKSWSDIDKMPEIQVRLMRALWPLLAPGGRLVYVTCTFARAENHDVVAAFLAQAPDSDVVPPASWSGWPGLGADDGLGRQILPGEAGADGFYYAALTKR